MVKTMSILTATRAEYGLLKPVIQALREVETLDVKVVVTGAHLSPEFGLTYRDIEHDGIEIDEKIEMLISADTPAAISKSMGLAMISFADYFARIQPDLLLVLGDRYETLAVSLVAMNQRIPIAHLYGGETTEGAVDESVRHAITKISYLHLTSTEAYRKRVIQLGEHPDRVHTVGALGIENVLQEPLLTKEELEKSLDFSLEKPYALVTFHPVTLEQYQAEAQIEELLAACASFPDMTFLFTKANADAEGRVINRKIDAYCVQHEHAVAFTSLGLTRYLSAMKGCQMVIGNSSSGLIEAPSFGVPTINIGDRQKGRMQAESVINCEPKEHAIRDAIRQAQSPAFQEQAKKAVNPYGDGKTSDKIRTILQQVFDGEMDLKKTFYDLEVKG
ncbi:UDP-N-acetylglucosamine 2-epimerase [Jeotgalibacillus aurantiacus]|uniref:UDP-N-acetylglucosamine 2-epimerase n=1 Tax=Jeotgalibacillus aurantiacus TaxID=2763266 RepID=UPI001D0B7C05|nr:UDP-N-acetylglucosamine 2-epimerase [Jeotgalibacillus aurantiacus]